MAFHNKHEPKFGHVLFPPRFISYLRIYTMQGLSDLGLEAQRQVAQAHVVQTVIELVAEFQEVESGKGPDRPQSTGALALCRTHRAVLAKLDRPACNAHLLPIRRTICTAFPHLASVLPDQC